MSYIYGRVDGADGILYADSLLTRRDETVDPNDPRNHSLKIHIVDSNNCIGVAGLWAPGVYAIEAFANFSVQERNKISSHDTLAQLLMKQCETYGHDISACDLIHLRRDEDRTRLFVIQNGLPRSVSEGFIGNSEFDAEFKSQLRKTNYVPIPGDHVLSEFSKENIKITQALNQVSLKPFKSIGLFEQYQWIRASTDQKHGFLFLASAISQSTGGQGRAVSSFFFSKPSPGLAIYFEDEKKGFMYCSGSTDFPIEVNAPTFIDFNERVKLKGEGCSSVP